MYVGLGIFAILSRRLPWIPRGKKEARISGLMKVFLLCILGRLWDKASLMKVPSESNSLPAALALWRVKRMFMIWLRATKSFLWVLLALLVTPWFKNKL